MDRYLTDKTCPRKVCQYLENLGIAALFMLLAGCVYMAVYGYQREGLSIGHLLLAAAAIAVAFALNPLMERKRLRLHAAHIVKALLASEEGSLAVDELDKVTGMRRASEAAAELREKGYLRDVIQRKGVVYLADRMPEAEEPEEEIKPIFKN